MKMTKTTKIALGAGIVIAYLGRNKIRQLATGQMGASAQQMVNKATKKYVKFAPGQEVGPGSGPSSVPGTATAAVAGKAQNNGCVDQIEARIMNARCGVRYVGDRFTTDLPDLTAIGPTGMTCGEIMTYYNENAPPERVEQMLRCHPEIPRIAPPPPVILPPAPEVVPPPVVVATGVEPPPVVDEVITVAVPKKVPVMLLGGMVLALLLLR